MDGENRSADREREERSAERAQKEEERKAASARRQDERLADCARRHPDSMTRRFKVLVRRAGLPLKGPHALRHTGATLALEGGIHPRVVQARMGHASITTTLQTYSHVTPALQEEAAEHVAAMVLRG